MADIELVINIPEEIYQHYKKTCSKRRGSIPESCIAFGTPLPKGHGRLGDLDRLYKVFERNVVGNSAFKDLFDIAPTIIEANTGETKK